MKNDNVVSEQSGTGGSEDIFPEMRKLAEKAGLDTTEHDKDDHFWHILATKYLRKRHFYFLSTKASKSESGADGLENRRNLRALLLEEALRDAEDYYKLEAEAGEDFLTGLPNRKGFQRDFERLLNSIQRNHRQNIGGLCTVFFDLDNFKKINDVLGHLIGDEILKLMGEELREQTRLGDLLVRCGGEEFVIIMPIETDAFARDKAKFYKMIEEKRINISSDIQDKLGSFEGSDRLPTDISVGSLSGGVKFFSVWEIREQKLTVDKMLDEVDRLAYKAKNNGRDRLYSPEGEVKID